MSCIHKASAEQVAAATCNNLADVPSRSHCSWCSRHAWHIGFQLLAPAYRLSSLVCMTGASRSWLVSHSLCCCVSSVSNIQCLLLPLPAAGLLHALAACITHAHSKSLGQCSTCQGNHPCIGNSHGPPHSGEGCQCQNRGIPKSCSDVVHP